jgi:hypothetical protein
MKRFWVCFLCWLLMFHSWLIVRLIPGLRDWFDMFPFGFMLGMLWINIPGMPLSHLMGDRYFPTEEFGVLPQGPVGYGLIVLFWVIVAAVLGWATSALIGRLRRTKSN